MRKPVVVITGAGGEIGHGLIDRLAERDRRIVTIDIAPRYDFHRAFSEYLIPTIRGRYARSS